jgi:hypothetical protein
MIIIDADILSTFAKMGELGPVEANRFINMPRKKRTDSVKRHREWQKHLDKDKFFKGVFS